MTCDAYIRREQRRRRGSGAPYEAKKLVGRAWKEGTERCGGAIVSGVRAVDEPYFGGCSAALELTFSCADCGNAYFPTLPRTEEQLNAFLNQTIQALPEASA